MSDKTRNREYGTFKRPIRTLPKRPPAVNKDAEGRITDTSEVVKVKEAALKAHEKLISAEMRRTGRIAVRKGPQEKLSKPTGIDPEQKERSRLYQLQLIEDRWKKRNAGKTGIEFKGPKVKTVTPGYARHRRRGTSRGYGSTAYSV